MAASNEVMGALHKRLAEVMLQMIEPVEQLVMDEEGNITDLMIHYPAPAVLAACTTFLKNNNITSIVDSDPALSALRDKLKERGRVSDADVKEAVKDYGGRLVQ